MPTVAAGGDEMNDEESKSGDEPRASGVCARSSPKMSVVLATYNRKESLLRLLSCLARQSLSPTQFEVIVVDDGSTDPVSREVSAGDYPFALTLLSQENAGPSAARHRGVLEARGDILVLIDDDMELPPSFLEMHLRYHANGRPTAVFGRYLSDPKIGEKTIFERYHGLKWDNLTRDVANGKVRVDGTLLATGNASMRREDYLRAGGLDPSLPRAEDMALGLDLEEIGVTLVYSDEAYSVHLSDHSRPEQWRARAFVHGRLEPSIARKHPTMAHADPWRFAFSLPLVGRILCVPSVIAPGVGERLAVLVYRAAEQADNLSRVIHETGAGLDRVAMRATGLVWGMEYFRGMRTEAGSLRGVMAGCATFLKKAATAGELPRGVPSWLAKGVRALTAS
jgi:GT2 family glycosyltransferase